mgnify:CR=1 FL=1
MPRHLIPALAVVALALALGVPAAAAQPAAPAAAAAARSADALDGWDDEDACVVDDRCDEDGWDDELACDDEDWDDELWDELDEDAAWADVAPLALAATDDAELDDELDGEWCEDDEAATAAPRLTALRATVAGAGRRARVRIAFRLSRAARVALTLAPAGRRARRGACARTARPRQRRAAGGRGCRTATAPRGAVVVAGRAGANRVELRRWRGARLAAGTYRLTATPKGAGARGAHTTFTIR